MKCTRAPTPSSPQLCYFYFSRPLASAFLVGDSALYRQKGAPNDYNHYSWKYIGFVLSSSKTWSFLYPQPVVAFIPFLCPNTQSCIRTHTHMCVRALPSIKSSFCSAEWTPPVHVLFAAFAPGCMFPTHSQPPLPAVTFLPQVTILCCS